MEKEQQSADETIKGDELIDEADLFDFELEDLSPEDINLKFSDTGEQIIENL